MINGDKAYIIATSISFVLAFVNDNTAMITNDRVWPIATIKQECGLNGIHLQ